MKCLDCFKHSQQNSPPAVFRFFNSAYRYVSFTAGPRQLPIYLHFTMLLFTPNIIHMSRDPLSRHGTTIFWP